MILDNIPYVRATEKLSSPDAAFTMIVSSFTGSSPEEYIGMYDSAFSSNAFFRWMMETRNMTMPSERVVVSCMEYLSTGDFRIIPVTSSLDVIYGSYIKRKMPVMAYGDFPMMRTTIPNAIVIIGKVGDYYIVHDPRGNANTGYAVSYGRNVLYHEQDLVMWLRRSPQGGIIGVRADS